MYLDDISFAGVTYDVNAPKGNNDALPGGNNGGRYAVYKDQEELLGYTKLFWNIAIDVTGKTGNIVTKATASGQPLENNATPVVTKYPIIDFNVAVIGGICATHPLDGAGSGVTTSYTSLSQTRSFNDVYGSVVLPTPPAGFALVQPGSFIMGSPVGELGRSTLTDETQHPVVISKGFFLGVTEVTQSEWTAFSGGTNPSCFQSASTAVCTTLNANGSTPVEKIDWFSALAFANAKSQAEGLQVCYTLTGCTDAANGWKDGEHAGCTSASFVGLSCSGYRIPTEAEWEYAARAGTTTANYAGNLTTTGCTDTVVPTIGWFCGNVSTRSQSVGLKLANAWGLKDMLGNVWEWTWDVYGTYPASATDPLGPGGSGGITYRGGSWNNDASSARAANRAGSSMSFRYHSIGMRLARSLP